MKSRLAPNFMIIVVILVFLGIIVGIFFAYGLILGQSSDKTQFTLLNNPDNEYRNGFHLDEAIMALRSDDFGRMARAGNYSIHYIHGEDVDTSGNAKNWIIAVKNNQSQFYFEYQDQEYGCIHGMKKISVKHYWLMKSSCQKIFLYCIKPKWERCSETPG